MNLFLSITIGSCLGLPWLAASPIPQHSPHRASYPYPKSLEGALYAPRTRRMPGASVGRRSGPVPVRAAPFRVRRVQGEESVMPESAPRFDCLFFGLAFRVLRHRGGRRKCYVFTGDPPKSKDVLGPSYFWHMLPMRSILKPRRGRRPAGPIRR